MENEILKIIADNQGLKNALRDLLERQFTLDEIATTMTNEAMGQVVRSRVEGLKKIDRAFKEIEGYKTFAEKPPGTNPAR